MPAVSMFAQKLYQHAFAASDIFKQQVSVHTCTVKPTNKGHFGTNIIEVVLFSEVQNVLEL